MLLLLGSAAACGPGDAPPATPSSNPERYRLQKSGAYWDLVGSDRVVESLRPVYPEFFAVVLDPAESREPDLHRIRDDLERKPVTRSNYDALNTVAIGYFELNYRAQVERGGERFFADSFRAAKLLAVPWRAYGEIDDTRLRDAILDFFEDAGTGDKLLARETAARIEPIAASLEAKESDPARRERIARLRTRILTAGR